MCRPPTFCLSLEAERRWLLGIEPLPGTPGELNRLLEGPWSITTPEDYCLVMLTLMALNQASSWSLRFVEASGGGGWFTNELDGEETPAPGAEEARKLITACWDDLTADERSRAFWKMEAIGRQAAGEQVEASNGTSVTLDDFLELFDGLLPDPEDESEWAALTMDPCTTTFCLALEEERRRLLGEEPLPVKAKVLHPKRNTAVARRIDAEEAFQQEHQRLYGHRCPERILIGAMAVAAHLSAEARSEGRCAPPETVFADIPDYLAAIEIVRGNASHREAANKCREALEWETLLGWALNRATGWGRWRQIHETRQRELLREQLRSLVPGAEVSGVTTVGSGKLRVTLSGGKEIEKKLQELLGDPMSMTQVLREIDGPGRMY